jgi:hypothetical protein
MGGGVDILPEKGKTFLMPTVELGLRCAFPFIFK